MTKDEIAQQEYGKSYNELNDFQKFRVDGLAADAADQGPPALRFDANGKAFEWNGTDWVAAPQWDRPAASGPSTSGMSQSLTFDAEGHAFQWNDRTEQWVAAPQFDKKPTASTSIQSPALRQFFEGRQAKDIPVGGGVGAGSPQSGGNGLLSRQDIETASATKGLQRGDVLGFLENYLIPAQAALPAGTDLPITAGGIYGEQGSPLGLTPLDASLTGTNPQFTGAAGDTSLGAGLEANAQLQGAGLAPTGDPWTDAIAALDAITRRAAMLEDPVTASLAEQRGLSPEAMAQTRLEASSPAFLNMNQANPQTGAQPVYIPGRGMMQPTAGGLIAAPMTGKGSTSGDTTQTPIGKGGVDLAEADAMRRAAAEGEFAALSPEEDLASRQMGRFGAISLDQPSTFWVPPNQQQTFTAGGPGVPGGEIVSTSGPLSQVANPTANRFDKPMIGSAQMDRPTGPLWNGWRLPQSGWNPFGPGSNQGADMLGSAAPTGGQAAAPMSAWMPIAQGLVSRLLADSRGRRKRPTGVMELAGSYL